MRRGDNLSAISEKYGVPVATLRKLNGMGRASSLQAGKRIKYGNKPKHHKKHNNTFRQKNRVDHSDGNKEITRLSHLFNKTLKSYIPAKELARINKKYKENRYQRRIRKMMRKIIPDGKQKGIMTGGAGEIVVTGFDTGDENVLPPGWEKLTQGGKTYYGNRKINNTQWQHPRPTLNPPLPDGWEIIVKDRELFYGNPTLKIAQWNHPALEPVPPATPALSPATPAQSPATIPQSPATTPAATESILPKKGEIKEVDAKDSLGNWYKGYIIKRFKFDVVPAVPEMLKVHFVGWGIDTDEYIPAAKETERTRSRTSDAATGQLTPTQKDDTIDGVVALYTADHMTRAKEKAEEEAKKFKEEEASKQKNQPAQTPQESAPPMEKDDDDNNNNDQDKGDNKDGKTDEAAEVKPTGKCKDEIKTPYAQAITLQVKANEEGELSVTVDPTSVGIDGLPEILNRGQEPVTPANQQPPVTPVASAPPQDTVLPPSKIETATVGGARRTRRKHAKRGNKRKLTRSRK